MKATQLKVKRLIIILVAIIGVTTLGNAQLTLKAPKWEKFAKITTEGVNLRKAPNTSSPKLLSHYGYGNNMGDYEAYYWGTKADEAVHFEVGDVFPVIRETDEWYCLYFTDMWCERFISSHEVYIMKKFCTIVSPVDFDDSEISYTEMEPVSGSDNLLIGTYYFGSPSRAPFVRIGHRIGKYVVAADYGDAGLEFARQYTEEGDGPWDISFDITKVKNQDIVSFLHKNKQESSAYDVWVKFPDRWRQFAIESDFYTTESYTFAKELPTAPVVAAKNLSNDTPVYDMVEELAQFPGDLATWLSQNVRYPSDCIKKGSQGRVLVQFVINTDGSIVDVVTKRSPDPQLSAEAERVVKSMPRWKPARQGNKVVRCRYVLPINFRLPSK